jgi:hypothetical protein
VSAAGNRARRARHWRLHAAVIIAVIAAFAVVKLADTFNHAGLAATAAAHHTTVNRVLGGGWLLTVLVVAVTAFVALSAPASRRRLPGRQDREPTPRRHRSYPGEWR